MSEKSKSIAEAFGGSNQTLISTKCTGNYFFKPTWFGMIIMIEKRYIYSDEYIVQRFEKCKIEDLFELGLVVTPLNALAHA